MNPIYKEILIYKYIYFFSNDKALKNANALNLADKAYVTDIFSDRETQEEYEGVTPMLIVDRLNNGEHLKVGSIQNLIDPNYTSCINPLLRHKDSVIMFMGCKEVYDLKEKLEKVLEG